MNRTLDRLANMGFTLTPRPIAACEEWAAEDDGQCLAFIMTGFGISRYVLAFSRLHDDYGGVWIGSEPLHNSNTVPNEIGVRWLCGASAGELEKACALDIILA